MGVSLIITVLNEASNIYRLLESIYKQDQIPDEVLIIDGGSTDNTTQIVTTFMDKINIKLYIKPGYNIAEGRNFGIKNSSYQKVLTTDAGCVLHRSWVKQLCKTLSNDSSDVVGGIFLPNARSKFEDILSQLTYPVTEDFLNGYLPSSRSFGFKKETWIDVGGYPNHLYTAEDTLFIHQIIKNGYNVIINPKAIVYWQPRSTPKQLFKQYYLYSIGNRRAKISPITFEAYGQNAFKFLKQSIIRTMRNCIKKADYSGLILIPIIITIIGFAKFLGSVMRIKQID